MHLTIRRHQNLIFLQAKVKVQILVETIYRLFIPIALKYVGQNDVRSVVCN